MNNNIINSLLMIWRRTSFPKKVFFLSIVLLMGNLTALIDYFLHPEIPYFDEEHIIVGGSTAFLTATLLVILAISTKYLRENEEKFRTLFDISPDITALLDLNLNIIMLNKCAAMTFGYESAEELLGASALDFIALEDQQRAVENIPTALENGILRNVEYTLLKKDGIPFPAEVNASVIESADGKPNAILVLIRDITERKRAGRELQGKLDEVERLNKFMVGRELRMEKMRERIRELEREVANLRSQVMQ